jgi:hypothetical protein
MLVSTKHAMTASTKGFYEVQLFILAGFCASALLAEKYISNQRSKLSLSSANGNGHSSSTSPAWKSKSTGYFLLLKDYLIVYTIVMGMSFFIDYHIYGAKYN